MTKIRVAIVGVGNCASSLVQGIHYYHARREADAIGLMHWELGGYLPSDVEVVAAFDVDQRKVGHDLSEAIFAPPNCTTVFCEDVPKVGVPVRMGKVLDGFSEHMRGYEERRAFVIADALEADHHEVVRVLRESGTYVECALEAGVALVNCMPVFIASDPAWAKRFADRGLPVVGDDIKAQLGATITHRMLTDLFRRRGVQLERTYQLNTGGNTDFLNMLNRSRLLSKKESKTEAVQSVAAKRIPDANIHVGPSDYVPWQNDNKVCFLRMEGKLFGDVPMNLELRLSVEDSPNSAGVSIDAIRCCKLGLERGASGALLGPSAFFMKHPPRQYTDDEAHRRTEEFIAGNA
jgi:myo-inositol-1-phosphate synthase